jgi:NCS1 family nucleobase:cation symporter-1
LTGICANLAIPSILVEARELPMTSAVDIERRLRAHYRQPAGVEQFGIEPVPEERKTTGWFDLFSIMFNFLINPGMMLSGGLMVAAGLSFQGALAAGFFGTIIALVFYLIMATLGVDYGIPGQVATRAVYGLRGAKLIPSLLRVIVTIYWFSFQTLVGASAIVAVLAKITGVTYPLVWVSVIFALIQACVAVIGFGSLKVLARVALPIKVMVLAYLFVLFAHHDDPNFEPAKVLLYPGASGWTWVLLAAWLNVTLAGWLTNITDAADFARYTRSRTDMWVGTIAAGALGALLSTALGAYGAAATLGKVTNPFVLTAQIETSWVAFLAVLVFLCVDDWTINVLNLYSGGLSLSNMFERLGRFWTTLIASVFGVALSGVPDVLNFFEYVTWFGNVFSPVAGVLVFDYLFVRRMQIDVVALYDPKGRYRYWAGFNPIAVAWTAVGFLICTYVIPTAWIPALLTLLITGVGYLLTVWILQRAKVPPQWGIP